MEINVMTIRGLVIGPWLALGLAMSPVMAEQWTATDSMAFILAAGWCSKEEGVMTERESLDMAHELTSWMVDEYGYTREQLIRIASEKDFHKRMQEMVRSFGGCRELLKAVWKKTGYP